MSSKTLVTALRIAVFVHLTCCLSYAMGGFGAYTSNENVQVLIDENEKLKVNISKLTDELNSVKEQLNNANERLAAFLEPEKKFQNANGLLEIGDISKAESIFTEISENFQCTKYGKMAKEKLEEIRVKREHKRKEEEKIAALNRDGFFRMKKALSFKLKDVTTHITDIGVRKKVIFDRNNYEYSYKTADKDSDYISFTCTISSSNKEPKLPAFYYGIIDNNGKIVQVKLLEYRFYKWDDYGSYLGNYNDNGNDFAKSKSVKFVVLEQIESNTLKQNDVALFTDGNMCFSKEYNSYGRPDIMYAPYGCDKKKNELKPSDFLNENVLIHVFRKK